MGSYYDTNLGTLLVGVFFNAFLYGLVTYQFAAYCLMKFNDSLVTRCMVLFLFLLDTFHSASVIYVAWYYTVTNYDNPVALSAAEWPYIFTPLAVALAALVTQIYLGFRIWRLTRSKFLYSMVILLATPSFVMGMITSMEAWFVKVFSHFPRVNPVGILWLLMQVVSDVFITITLVIIFSRSRTGFRETDTILSRFIRGAIQTGLFASLFSLADLITRLFCPHTTLYIVFAIPLGRVYTNTLMDTLLTRQLLMEKTDRAEPAAQSMEIDSVFWNLNDTQAVQTVRTTSTHLTA